MSEEVEFALDRRLAADTVFVADWPLCRVLLMDDARFAWLILAPRRAGLVELDELDEDDSIRLMHEIQRAMKALRAVVACDKLNVGTLGNIVRQLHVHVVARRENDAAWPGPVWGHGPAHRYLPEARDKLIEALGRESGPEGAVRTGKASPMAEFSIEPLAEDALLLRFGDGIDLTTNARVHAAARALRDAKLPGICDIAPTYATLLLRFDPLAWTEAGAQPFEQMARSLKQALSPERLLVRGRGLGEGANITQAIDVGDSRNASPLTPPSPPSSTMGERGIAVVPVCYGSDYGPDLDAVAEHARLSRDEVIARHAAAEYTVAMLGFAPGFPYLLGLDVALHAPRRADPRTRVPAGSVAIGGAQTGIYPRELPGGWQLIGRTPLALFDPDREPPCLLAPGDRVRFRAIDAQEFARLAERQA